MITSVTAFFTAQAAALRSACATTLACEIALVIVMALHLPNPAWALITVFVLATPTAGSSLQKGVLRLVGTAVGAGLALVLIDWFDQAPLAFTLALFALCVAAAYGAAGTRYPYAYLIGFITIVIIAMQALPEPDQAVHLAFARACEVGIGVATAVLVRLSLWPVCSSVRLRSELAATLEQSASLLLGTAPGGSDAAVVALIRSRQQHQTFLQAADGESDLTRAQHRRHARAVALVGAVVDAVVAAEAIASASGTALLADVRAALAGALVDLGQALRRQRARGGAAIAGALQSLRIAPDTRAGDPAAGYASALAQTLATLADRLARLARLSDYLGPGGPDAPAEVDASAAAAHPATPRVWPDRARLVHAVKVAIVVVSVLWLWMVFHLPGGMQGMVTAALIAQRTVGATQLKGRLRLLGGLIGGTLGILVASFAIPGVSSLPVFCLLTAPILFASAWLNDGSPRYGYVGFQSGFAFILTLVAGSSPEPDTLAPVFRVCGIVIGIAAASVILRIIAPIDAWVEALRGLGRMLASIAQDLRGLRTAAGAAERSALRDQAAALIAELAPGATRRGWPRWPLDRLLALESRLAALVGGLDRGEAAAPAHVELSAAAAQLAAAAGRLGADVAVRRAATRTDEVEAARAAMQGVLRGGASPSTSPAVLARVGALQTAAALLAAIEHLLSASSPASISASGGGQEGAGVGGGHAGRRHPVGAGHAGRHLCGAGHVGRRLCGAGDAGRPYPDDATVSIVTSALAPERSG